MTDIIERLRIESHREPYEPIWRDAIDEIEALRAEVERLKRVEFCWDEWLEKTEWVQRTCKPKELGMHRADVLRLRIEQAEARAERLAEALREATAMLLADYPETAKRLRAEADLLRDQEEGSE